MKTFWKYFLVGFLLAIVIVGGIYLFKRHTATLTHDYNETISEYQTRVDSLLTALNEVEVQIDTVEVLITKIVEKKVVVVQEIEMLPASGHVAYWDSLTGDHKPSRLIADSTLVVTPMPRVVHALEVMAVKDLLEQEVDLLCEKTELQETKIETLVKINEADNEIIYFQGLEINKLDKSNERLREVNKWLAGGIGALILMVAIK